jgi:hypothetical protein
MFVLSFAVAAALELAPGDRHLDRSLRTFLQREFRQNEAEERAQFGREGDIHYAASFVDLNGDGRKEAVAYIESRGFCGSSGCYLHIYQQQGRSWREVLDYGPTKWPIQLLPARHHGWSDLAVFVQGAGEIRGFDAELHFNGKTYKGPISRLPRHRWLKGRVLITQKMERPLY